MKRPILIALIGYIIGILWELYLSINIAPFAIAILCIYFVFSNKMEILKKFNITILFVFLIPTIISNSIMIYLDNRYENLYKNIENEGDFIVTIISNKTEKEYNSNYVVRVESINGDDKYKNTKLILKISNNSSIQLKYGDKIFLKGIYSGAEIQRNYKGFDYSQYLRTQKIFGIVTCMENNIEILTSSNLSNIKMMANKINNKMKVNLQKTFKEKEANFLIGILLGDNKNIDEEIKEDFRNSGLYHILAVSGTHMSYIILGIVLLLNKTNISKAKKNILKIMGICFFGLITNSSVSVIRAAIMAILAINAQIFFRKNDIINSICVSMIIILIDNPYSLINVSFQLSYGGVIGIVLLNNRYLELLKRIKIIEKLANKISVILSAQTMIIPVMILQYNTLSCSFLIANILTAEIIGIIIIMGFLTLLISFVSIKVSSCFAIIVSVLIKIFIKIAEICAELPLSKILIVTPSMITVILYYVVVLLSSNISKNKIQEFIKKHYANIRKFILISIIIIIVLVYISSYVKRDLKIYFIDVGQGDSTLIITPNNKKILIDGGGSETNTSTYDVGEDTLVPYLLDRRISKLDFIMISHFDSDHCGGIIAVLNSIKVKNIIISKQIDENNNFKTIINIAKNKKVNIIVVKKGDVINVDNNVEIKILYPENKLYFDDLNNNSIVAKLIYYKFSILFTGDIEKIAENKIIQTDRENLKSTILKVAHHGSKTSSIEEFLLYVKPKMALIGVGKNNKFGHPNTGVIDRLDKLRYRYI